MRMNANDANKIIYKELSYKINGILFKVHNELGRFKKEKNYCDAIELELKQENLPYEREKLLLIILGNKKMQNRLDFVIDNKIILEIKAKSILEKEDYYQLLNYLNMLNIKLGIIVNFRRRYLNPKRILNSRYSHKFAY